jgi:hypothetical protein
MAVTSSCVTRFDGVDVAMSDRAFNGRVLLEHAVKEIAADLQPDPSACSPRW